MHESLQVLVYWPGRYHVTANDINAKQWTCSDPCTHVGPLLTSNYMYRKFWGEITSQSFVHMEGECWFVCVCVPLQKIGHAVERVSLDRPRTATTRCLQCVHPMPGWFWRESTSVWPQTWGQIVSFVAVASVKGDTFVFYVRSVGELLA